MDKWKEKTVTRKGGNHGGVYLTHMNKQGGRKWRNTSLLSLRQVVTRNERWSGVSAKVLPAGNDRNKDV